MTTYEWAPGSRFLADAQQVGVTIQIIADREGVCHPSRLVDEVRSPAHPLHDQLGIDWDDPTAAEKWRRHQARNVINSVLVVTDEGSAPAFTSVSVLVEDGVERGYVSQYRIATEDDLREQAKAELKAAVAGWRRRYRHLSAWWDRIESIMEETRV